MVVFGMFWVWIEIIWRWAVKMLWLLYNRWHWNWCILNIITDKFSIAGSKGKKNKNKREESLSFGFAFCWHWHVQCSRKSTHWYRNGTNMLFFAVRGKIKFYNEPWAQAVICKSYYNTPSVSSYWICLGFFVTFLDANVLHFTFYIRGCLFDFLGEIRF